MLEVEINIFEDTYIVDEYKARNLIEYTKDVLENLDKPFIFTHYGLGKMKLTTRYHDDEVYGLLNYLYSLSTAKYREDALAEIAVEDVEWTNWRNEKCSYKAYQKLTLKQHIQEIVRRKFTGILELLENTLEIIIEHDNKEKTEREDRKNKYRIGNVYHQKMPKGGEDGTDGYFDAEIINNATGESTRFIKRDLFDVGQLSYPYRLKDSEDKFKMTNRTEEEKAVGNWLSEFSPFGYGIRL